MSLTMYTDSKGQGKSKTISKSTAVLPKGFKNEISSFKVNNDGELWVAYSGDNFGGDFGPWGPFSKGGIYSVGAGGFFRNDDINGFELFTFDPKTTNITTAQNSVITIITGRGQNIITPMEVSEGVEPIQSDIGTGEEGIIDTVGDIIQGGVDIAGDVLEGGADIVEDVLSGAISAGGKVFESARDALEGLPDIINDLPDKLRAKVKDAFWKSPFGSALRIGLIVAGVAVLVGIIAFIIIWRNRNELRQEALKNAEFQSRMAALSARGQFSTVRELATIAEENPQTTEIATRAGVAGATGGASEIGTAAQIAGGVAQAQQPNPQPMDDQEFVEDSVEEEGADNEPMDDTEFMDED